MRTRTQIRQLLTVIENLEPRRLFATTINFDGDVLEVTGDSGKNIITLNFRDTSTGPRFGVTASGVNFSTRLVPEFIQIDGAGGDDTIRFNGFGFYRYTEFSFVILSGGRGNDRLEINSDGSAIAEGGDGNDKLYINDVGDEGVEHALFGDNGDDSLYGSPYDDALFGDAGRDKIYGQKGDDILVGGVGNDSLFGGPGDDELEGGHGADSMLGEDGLDTFYVYNDGYLNESKGDTINGGRDFDEVVYQGAFPSDARLISIEDIFEEVEPPFMG
jgi:Ca2+-binding RTX toxin-like protein